MGSLHSFRALALALILGATPLPAGWTAAEILAKAKEAHGGEAWDQVRTLAATASFLLDGQGPAIPGGIREDLANGRYQRSHGVGEQRRCWSFDGHRFWYRAGPAAPFTVAGPLREQVARACAYMHARGFWFPDRFPASMEYLGLAGEGDPCHVIRLVPPGALPVECRVDARSWLIRRVAWRMERGLWCHTFSDYREFQGLMLAYRICCGWEEPGCQTLILVERYVQEECVPEGRFRCQEPAPEAIVPGP